MSRYLNCQATFDFERLYVYRQLKFAAIECIEISIIDVSSITLELDILVID
jgi:hypothetical protein